MYSMALIFSEQHIHPFIHPSIHHDNLAKIIIFLFVPFKNKHSEAGSGYIILLDYKINYDMQELPSIYRAIVVIIIIVIIVVVIVVVSPASFGPSHLVYWGKKA